MSFWRSNTVNCYQLILPRENAHRIVEQLGRLGNIEFKHHLNPAEKPFLPQIKLVEDALQKLAVLQDLLRQEAHSFPNAYSRSQFQAFLEIADRRYRQENRSYSHLLETVIEEIEAVWGAHRKLSERMEELKEQSIKLKEELAVLAAGQSLFGERLYRRVALEDDFSERQIQFKCGVLLKQDEAILRRTLFRVTKGLSIYYSVEYLNDQDSPEQHQCQVIFFLVFGYGQSKVLSSKVSKLLDNYKITSYKYPTSQGEASQLKSNVQKNLLQNSKLQELVQTQMNLILKPLVQLLQNERKINLTKFEYYKLYLIHEKKIYEKLNDMKLHHTFYEAVIYIESKNIELVATELHLKLVDDQMPSPQFIPIEAAQKPTLFDLNAVTRSPYEVLSAYGTPHYKEVNPAIFNLVTFPFMFGVMFGDIVHGLVLLAFGLLLILSESMRNPILDSLRPHRFTIALMGFFSFYCGLIYNEYLSLSLNLFGSCYEIEGEAAVLTEGCVYSIGVDPVWSISLNGLNFTNSLKMKMAVIIAIAHMSLGIVLKSVNYWHFNKKIHILIEVLPQLAFLLSVFGYMDFLIVFKWLHAWTGGAPSIITTMINIPLELGGTTDCCGGEPLWGTYGTTSQDKLQLFLLSLAMISIPIMFAFPLAYEYLQRRVKQRQDESLDFNEELANSKAIEREQLIESANSEEEMPLKEIAVYQFIETIEFVLGCISNTASYLRLWALSLAHSQLSEVFFESTVERGLENGFLGILYNLILFPIFAGITFGILLCMDSMQCFLHTLRLHWVEFQSKFYKGDGQEFRSSDFLTYINLELQRRGE